MKKIRSKFNEKDRIVCITGINCHDFYYVPFGTKKLIWLFSIDSFSGSVFAYFREKGRQFESRGFGLTIHELYQFKDYHNPKLTKVIERIPTMVDYVIRNNITEASNCNPSASTEIDIGLHVEDNYYKVA